MMALTSVAALLCTAAGLVCGLIAAVTTRNLRFTLSTALEFWMAAGLLRLTGEPSVPSLATAAGILLVRQLVTRGWAAAAEEWVPGNRADSR